MLLSPFMGIFQPSVIYIYIYMRIYIHRVMATLKLILSEKRSGENKLTSGRHLNVRSSQSENNKNNNVSWLVGLIILIP